MFLRRLVLVTILGALAGCGGGGGDGSALTAPPRTVIIQGIVSDDAVVGAAVVVSSLADGRVLATVPSTPGGAFSTPEILESQLASGRQVSATGGVMGSTAFVGTLRAVYGSSADYLRSHATLYTTALLRAAESDGTAAAQLVSRTASIAAAAVQRSMLPSDWSDPYASSPLLASVRLAVQVGESVDTVTTRLGAQMTYRPVLSVSGATVCSVVSGAGMTICSARIGSAVGKVTDPTGRTLVSIPPGVLTPNCYRDFHAQISRDGTSVKVVWSDPETLPCVGQLLNPITLTLPALRSDANQLAQVPDACPTAMNLGHAAMRECRTTTGPTGQTAPGVFVSDGSTYRVGVGWLADRTRDPTLATAHQTKTFGAVIEYRYGAMLSRRTGGGNLNAVPVLLVHGYTLSGVANPIPFGGHDGTWGSLPDLIFGLRSPIDRSAAWFEPYNFQWRTNTSFLDAADDLANAILKAYSETGNRRVHIVAHSFGGILARVVLQSPYRVGNAANPNWAAAAEKVASLTTVGTPHSGVNDTGSDLIVGPATALPMGWARPLALPTSVCGQLTCYEAGGTPSVPDWAIKQLRRGSSTVPSIGYLIAELANTSNLHSFRSDLFVQVLVGQQRIDITNSGNHYLFDDGDNLITYAGQRFTPAVSAIAKSSALLFNESGPAALGARLLSERVLGLGARAPAPPQAPAASFLFNPKGYAHTSALALLTSSPEVEIPAGCAAMEGTGLGCQHETWVHVKSLLDWMTGGAAALNFPAVVVQGASCTVPVAGVAMRCTISGVNLPLTTTMSASNCSPAAMSAVAGGSDTTRQFTCTPTTLGALVTVTYNVPGYAGTAPNIAPVVTAANPNNAVPTASFTVNFASALVNQAVTFDPSASSDPDGRIATYSWSYGDGQTAVTLSNTSVSHTYANAGNYTITLTVTDNLGATGIATRAIVVSAPTTLTNLFVENFDGSSVSSTFWTQSGTSPVTVAGGLATTTCSGHISTRDKVTFSGNSIVIEARFAGQVTSFRDTNIALVDVVTGDTIIIGDTDYGNVPGYVARPGLYGLYTIGSGLFNLDQSGNNHSVSTFKEYRLTLTGTSLRAERGDSLSAITETAARTLPTSIAGRTFYLQLRQGGQFCPGTHDWIRVMVDSAQPRPPAFAEEFDGAALNLSKWSVLTTAATPCCAAGQSGVISVSNGVFSIAVPGGSNGFNGISDGNILRPVLQTLSGDFSMTLAGQEISRQSNDLNPTRVVTELGLISGSRRFGVYIVGDALSGSGNNSAGPAGHRIYTYADGATLPLGLDLPVGSHSRFEFRARRVGNRLFLGFRILAADAWQEVMVPTLLLSSETLGPTISLVSGNGGTVGGSLSARNASFVTQLDYFRIE